MADTFNLQIVTPERKAVDQQVEYVSVTGSEGEFGVLAGHAEFLTTLVPGELRYTDADGDHYLAISWGYAEVKADTVIILADNAETADEIDFDRAEVERDRWKAELEKTDLTDSQRKLFESKLSRAVTRIQVSGRVVKK